MRSQKPFRGISWLIKGRLGGCARPDTEAALDNLQDVRATLLISLTAEWAPDVQALNTRAIASLHVPIKDFTPPSSAQALEVCNAIEASPVTIIHCAAGKGRTGTLLTAYLIYQGMDADDAIKKARSANPEWIETAGQIEFLKQF